MINVITYLFRLLLLSEVARNSIFAAIDSLLIYDTKIKKSKTDTECKSKN